MMWGKERSKNTDGEGRRAGAQQTRTEGRDDQKYQTWPGKAPLVQRWHLRKSHTCSKLHACSAELYKEPHVTIVTPAAAAAVVMVTITMVGVDQKNDCPNALLTWSTNQRNLPWIYTFFNENAWREIPNCCIHKHYFFFGDSLWSAHLCPRLNSSAPLRYIDESLTTTEETVTKRRHYTKLHIPALQEATASSVGESCCNQCRRSSAAYACTEANTSQKKENARKYPFCTTV